jgi:transcriptional regulator with XRE-family HTH domain
MNIYKIIGHNIRGYREKINWSQEKLAVRSHLTTNYIGNIERAERKITIETLVKIAKILKIGPQLLLIQDSYKTDTET